MTNEINIHQHGYVRLIDVMPSDRQGDRAIVDAARVSYGKGTRPVSDDRTLIRYLMRHGHTSPFEMVEIKLQIKAPIFVARQWLRTRTANVNEVSGRYSLVPDEVFFPQRVRMQSATNSQGGEEPAVEDDALWFQAAAADAAARARTVYEDALATGISRELARIVLPLSTYTEFVWKIDLHNLLRFLLQRTDPHAQREIRDYADAILALVEPLAPLAVEAWRDYQRDALTLSRLEVEAIRTKGPLATTNQRELAEFAEKLERLREHSDA